MSTLGLDLFTCDKLIKNREEILDYNKTESADNT